MIFHDFARTLYFHVTFFVVFGQFRCFLVKTRYIHVLFISLIWKSILRHENVEKTGFWFCSDAEPCVFTISLINGFSKPCVFSIGFHEYGFAAVQWIAAPAADFSRKACKNWGFWKHAQEKACENTGFCTRDSPEPLFLQHILVGK